jgi:hypothetical protein
MTICTLCELELATTRHHFLPKQTWRRREVQSLIDRKLVDKHRSTRLCGDCHNLVHASFTNDELVDRYISLEQYRVHPKICAHLAAKREFLRRHRACLWPTADHHASEAALETAGGLA